METITNDDEDKVSLLSLAYQMGKSGNVSGLGGLTRGKELVNVILGYLECPQRNEHGLENLIYRIVNI